MANVFAYRRKVFCVCPQGLLRIRKRLQEGFSFPAQRRFAPFMLTSLPLSAYFRRAKSAFCPT